MFTLKKSAALVGMISVLGIGAMGIGGSASAAILGTKHNLTIAPASQTGTTETCIFCHTPHNAAAATAGPLWNRNTDNTGYTMYSSSTIDMTVGTAPQGVSLACLSCHDGVISYNSVVNTGGATILPASTVMTGANMVGKVLTSDHPISITYDITKDTDFNAAVSGKVDTLPLYGASSDQVECGSCHDPHESTNAKFLRKTNGASALCLTCHKK